MKKWFSHLVKPAPEPPPAGDLASPAQADSASHGNDALGLQKEVQELRMDLQTREQSIASLKQEIERMRLRQEQIIGETVETRLMSLFSDLAGPASQILTQGDLLEKQGKPVQSRDVLLIARRIVRAMERYGAVFSGQVGEQVIFDPNLHTPINPASQPQAGQTVTIRFVGVTYQGKTIYKAVVE